MQASTAGLIQRAFEVSPVRDSSQAKALADRNEGEKGEKFMGINVRVMPAATGTQCRSLARGRGAKEW
jgi:hypothetical protein